MDDTIRRLAKTLGATSLQAAGHEAGFLVQDDQGAQLRVNLELTSQRLMATLVDPAGTTRCSLDMAPVTEAFEDPSCPGRVTLRIGHQLVHLDGQPSIGIELESIPTDQRGKSQRFLRVQQRNATEQTTSS